MRNPFDGDEWEKIIDDCYRLRYQKDGYTIIDANINGDSGIEGYIGTGVIVYQCYCPEKKYSDDELARKLKIKVSKDIKKLLENGKGFKRVGVNIIKEWHFVTPEYRDKRIVEFCEKKRQEVLEVKKQRKLDYISDDFRILIKTSKDFIEELHKLSFLEKFKYDVALKKTITQEPDWSMCDSKKKDNIERKINAIIDSKKNREAYSSLLTFVGCSYIDGIELLSKIQEVDPIAYEKIISLNQMYKKEVHLKCLLNDDKSINKEVFNNILNEYEEKISKDLGEAFTKESLAELKWDLVSSWIADCPLNFV